MDETAPLIFKLHDYFLFATMLICSTSIGLYFGFIKKKDMNIKDFLLGKRDMQIFPIGISIAGSIISGLAMSGLPVEVYTYGVTFGLTAVVVPVSLVIIHVSILPVLYNLRICSVFEYIELRFSRRIRKLVSFIYAVNVIGQLPVIMYLSAVSLEQGTGFNSIYISILLCLACTFYTAVGGIKAVVWSDCLQFTMMIVSVLITTCLGTGASGGFSRIISEAYGSNRFHIAFDPDVTLHNSFWMMTIGHIFYWTQVLGTNQTNIQKFMTLPSLEHVKKALILFGLVSTAMYVLLSYLGLIMYSHFLDCDPLTSGQIKYPDQLVAYYILNISEIFPGLAGLYIAGITSAGLSTFSAGTNALVSTIFNDFVEPYLPEDVSQRTIGAVIKLTAAFIGIICTVLVVVVEQLGGIFVLIFSVSGITSGPTLGLFLMGLFTRRANSKGGLLGVIGSIGIMTWITAGALHYRMNKVIDQETMEISVEGCVYPYNVSFASQNPKLVSDFETPPLVYRISYYYYVFMGAVLVFLIGLPISWMTKQKKEVGDELLSPIKTWFLRKSKQKLIENPEINGEVALKLIR